MLTFKVINEGTAKALSEYWKRSYSVLTSVRPFGDYFEVVCEDPISAIWREVCEAFVAGRQSVVS